MKPASAIFVCARCDAQFAKWAGRCLQCGAWSTIAESRIQNLESRITTAAASGAVLSLQSFASAPAQRSRIATGIAEVDRVLGGGLVPGSFLLLGGEPGIGKSTLALQLAGRIQRALYVSGEESVEQIMLRAHRLGLAGAGTNIAHTQNADDIVRTILEHHPPIAIVDSVQTISSAEVSGEMGSVAQVRANAAKLMSAAKSSGTAVLLIGHVTKDGSLAGPKTLEHVVDIVLSFEGDAHRGLRILRALKNRFGSTDDVGVFDMSGAGLAEVPNPAEILLSGRASGLPGSILTCLMDGRRPFLVEIQALVTKTAFGYPARRTSGFDLNRLHLLSAVLQKHTGMMFSQYDIHLNVAGGLDAREPAADIAVCMALASAYKDKVLGNDLVAFGEVGLGGEVKAVAGTEKRLAFMGELGLKRAILAKERTMPHHILVSTMPVANIKELIANA